MTDMDVISAIRACHLKANIAAFESDPQRWGRPDWSGAYVDPGGTIFGPGPYLKVPIVGGEWGGTTQRVYAPARLRRRLAALWVSRKQAVASGRARPTARTADAKPAPRRRSK